MSVALHAVLLLIYGEVRTAPPRPAAPSVRMVWVAPAAREPAPAAARPALAAQPRGLAPEPPSQPAQPAPAVAAPAESPPPAEPLLSRTERYFASDEVDVRSSPLADWVLHSEELPPQQVVTVQLKLHISAEGRIDQYEVLSSSAETGRTMDLLRDIAATPLLPARRDGAAVASIVDVEITIESDVSFGNPRPPVVPYP